MCVASAPKPIKAADAAEEKLKMFFPGPSQGNWPSARATGNRYSTASWGGLRLAPDPPLPAAPRPGQPRSGFCLASGSCFSALGSRPSVLGSWFWGYVQRTNVKSYECLVSFVPKCGLQAPPAAQAQAHAHLQLLAFTFASFCYLFKIYAVNS